MKKKYIILGIVITLILLRAIIGVFNIPVKRYFDNPIYELKINEKKYGMVMEIRNNQTIIPYMLNFYSIKLLAEGESRISINYGDKIILDVKGYNCYGKTGEQINCMNLTQNTLKEINNIEFKDMYISGGSQVGITNKKVYEGEYIEDITHLLQTKGIYNVIINVEHDNIKSHLEFVLDLI